MWSLGHIISHLPTPESKTPWRASVPGEGSRPPPISPLQAGLQAGLGTWGPWDSTLSTCSLSPQPLPQTPVGDFLRTPELPRPLVQASLIQSPCLAHECQMRLDTSLNQVPYS
ncbi:rCG30787 [Rattus norvegicus]|uniref:RCG30787 n=1 Tax=Rattus norvegicus TaxID=10116 RepID=A6IUC0_RAT|nr:rCG30787 [Rattus norvegicus]